MITLSVVTLSLLDDEDPGRLCMTSHIVSLYWYVTVSATLTSQHDFTDFAFSVVLVRRKKEIKDTKYDRRFYRKIA